MSYTLNYAKKSRCTNCAALKTNKSSYKCVLGLKIDYKVIDGIAIQPTPTEACYRPETEEQVQTAKKLMEGRNG